MADIILITGGSRSGKSSYAQRRAEETTGSKLFIATSPHTDAEMDDRIRRHQQERHGKGWQLCEEEIDLAGAIRNAAEHDVLLIDCITLWVNNILFQQEENAAFSEDDIARICALTVSAARQHPGTIFFVTNEVGAGIVPESALVRRYRDMVGRCNQIVAAAANQVIHVQCGIPLFLKNDL